MSVLNPAPLAVVDEGIPNAPKREQQRRRRMQGSRPGWFVYTSLVIVLGAAIFPFYWSFLIGSGDASTHPRPEHVVASRRQLPRERGIRRQRPRRELLAGAVELDLQLGAHRALGGRSSRRSPAGRSPSSASAGSKWLLVFVVATMAVPTQLGVVPLYILFSDLGWTGSIGAIIIPALTSAFGVFWMTQYLQQAVPDELIEAARVDGASSFRTFLTVGLPAARPAAAMLGLFTFVSAWNNFFWPFIVLDRSDPTLPVALSLLQSNYFVDYSHRPRGRAAVDHPAPHPLRLRGQAARERHHGGSREGMTIELGGNPTTMSDTLVTTDALATRAFPSDFLFGAATAAFQIEGAASRTAAPPRSGTRSAACPARSSTPTTATSPATTTTAMPQDVALMQRLGLQTYRFSTSWSRVQPDGGPVNPKGLDFYSRLVDELLEAGIKPWLTLYHWDLPQALEERGGWANRDTAYRFRDYALHVHDALGDRVDVWTTLNEPWCSSFLGYTGGAHAPGRQDVAAGLAAGHHLLLAHGLAVQALRERDPDARARHHAEPHRRRAGRPDAPRRRRRRAPHRRAVQPVLPRPDLPRRTTPATCWRMSGTSASTTSCSRATSRSSRRPIDTLGVNYYHGESVSDRPAEQPAARAGADRPPDAVAVPGRRRRVQPPAGPAAHGDGLGGAARGPARAARARARGLRGIRRRRASTSPRTAPPTTTSSPRTARVHDAERAEFLDVAPRRDPRRDRRGRAGARLLLLVAAWTTSSGRGATTSGSASCASTTRRRSAP